MTTTRIATTFKGLAVWPEDIQLGDAEKKGLPLVSPGGQLLTANFVRLSATIKIRGVPLGTAEQFVTAAAGAAFDIYQGSAVKETLILNGRTLEQAVLISATISEPIQVGSGSLVEELVLTYESQVFV